MAKKVVASNKSEAAFGVARETSRAARPSAPGKDTRRDTSARSRVEDERWRIEKQTLRRAALELAGRRAQLKMTAMADLATVGEDDSLEIITNSLKIPLPKSVTQRFGLFTVSIPTLLPRFSTGLCAKGLLTGVAELVQRWQVPAW